MPIEVQWMVPELPGVEAFIARACEECFKLEGVGEAYMTVRITDDNELHALNNSMRHVDAPTDVLSFPRLVLSPQRTAGTRPKLMKRRYDPFLGGVDLGDCAISLHRAQSQADEYGHMLTRELTYLAVHSAFHLMGYDHMNETNKREMREREKAVMLNMEYRELYDKALQMLDFAYAPYSNFRVGACLLAADGRVFTGCNVENASYGAAICAERCAVTKAVSEGATRFTAVAVASSGGIAYPCGICRQVLNEFSENMVVIVGDAEGNLTVKPLAEILPESFGPNDLKGS